MDKDSKNHTPFSPFLLPVIGLREFAQRPHIWWRPLAWTMLSLLGLGVFFCTLLLTLWPTSTPSLSSYFLEGTEAFGISLLATLFVWMFVLPIPTRLCYEGLLKQVLADKHIPSTPETFSAGIASGCYLLKKTAIERLLWAVIPCLLLFVFPPAFTILTFIAAGYITLQDAVDLSLSLQGVTAQARWEYLRTHRTMLLCAGITSGILLFFFLFTLIGYLFLLPSLYVGTLLFVAGRD